MKILFLGNSITYHSPKADIGWYGNYGMAASCEEKDYVHVLTSLIEAEGITVETTVKNIADFEREPDKYDLDTLSALRNFNADVIIVRIAENTSAKNLDPFREKFPLLLDYLINGRSVKLLCIGSFWKNREADGIIKTAAEAKKGEYISLDKLHDKKYQAIGLFEHEGVAIHPSDYGMKAIAETAFSHMKSTGIV